MLDGTSRVTLDLEDGARVDSVVTRYRKLSFRLLGAMALLMFSGCLEIDPLVQGAPTKEQFDMESRCYLGSAYRDRPYGKDWLDGGDQDHTLFSVRPKYNYWYAWATVLSFGIVMPMDIEWKYNKD